MSSLQPAMTIVMTEISIILIALMSYLGFRYVRNNRNITSAIRKLANKIRCGKDDRENMLRDFLVQTCSYDEETATTAAEALIEKERLFYTSLMETYLNRDNDALINMDNKTEEVIGAYRNLLTVSVKAIATEAQGDLETRTQQLSKTIDDLSVRNKTLAEEVTQLKKEMDVTVEEYASAFRHKQAQAQGDTRKEDIPATENNTAQQNNTDIPATEPDDAIAAVAALDEPDDAIATVATPDESDDDISAVDSTPDDSIEPDFETRGFNSNNGTLTGTEIPEDIPDIVATEPLAPEVDGDDQDTATVPAEDDISADLEALAAHLDTEEGTDINPDIPMDGLEDDDKPANTQKTGQL